MAAEVIWLMPPASNASQQGFIRVTNLTSGAVNVTVRGFDDAGTQAAGSPTFSLGPYETKPFNSLDLENGNPAKGLNGALGKGTGNWRLVFESTGAIDVSALIRTPDGFLTSVHDPDPNKIQVSRFHVLQTVNPAENINQISVMRLVNPWDSATKVTIYATDDAGGSFPRAGESSLVLPARAAVELSSGELESGAPAKGFGVGLGDGAGKWNVTVVADIPIKVMGLLFDPKGYLTELPTTGIDARSIGYFTCDDFAGAMVYSQEDEPKYLGFFGSDLASASINNQYGSYGSSYSSTSMRNQYSQYGSPYSTFSATNDFGGPKAPVVVKDGKVIATITTNQFIQNGISLGAIDTCDFSLVGQRADWVR